jgi:hypothetical protein
MAETSILQSAIDSLHTVGFFDIMLPFLLVFSIVFGVLERAQMFGEKRSDLNAIIAFVIGLIVVVSSTVLNLMTGFLPWVGLMVVVFLCFIMLTVMFWGEASNLWENKAIKYGGAIVVLSLIGFYWAYTLDIFSVIATEENTLPISTAEIASLAAIFIFLLAIVMVVKGGGDSKT